MESNKENNGLVEFRDLIWDGRYKMALDIAMRYVELFPDEPEGYVRMGEAHLYMEHYPEALERFLRAIELDKNHYDSWIFMNITYSLMGDKLNAMKAFEKAIKINPSMEDAWNNLAKIYFYHHKYDIALSCIDKALLISPARAKTIRNKAVLLGKMGRFQEKKTILEAAIKKFPDDPYIAYSLGHCYFDKKNYKTALIYFKKAMTKAKEEEDNDIKLIATGMVGYSHWKLGENDKALTIYNDIIENYPFYAKGYYISAAIYASMGNINKAVEFLKKTIEIDDGYRDIAREDPDIAPIKNTDEFRKLVGGK